MKKWCIIVAALALAFGVSAQAKRLGVLDFKNLTGDEVYSNLTDTTSAVIDAAVRYKGAFEIVEKPGYQMDLEKAGLRAFAAETACDHLVYGTLEKDETGSLVLNGCIYSRAGDSVFAVQERVGNLIDIFESSDAISLALLSKLYNEKVTYGSIAVAGERAGRNYDVFVNGAKAGRNVEKVPNVPDGYKDVKIVSASGPDKGKILVAQRVFVETGKAAAIALPEPVAVAETPKAASSAAPDKRNFRFHFDLGLDKPTPFAAYARSGAPKAGVQVDFGLDVDFAQRHSLLLNAGAGSGGSAVSSSGTDSAGTPYTQDLALAAVYSEIGYGYIFRPSAALALRPFLLLSGYTESYSYTLLNTTTGASTTGYLKRTASCLTPGLDVMYNYDKRFSFFARSKLYIRYIDTNSGTNYAMSDSSGSLDYAFPGFKGAFMVELGAKIAFWELK